MSMSVLATQNVTVPTTTSSAASSTNSVEPVSAPVVNNNTAAVIQLTTAYNNSNASTEVSRDSSQNDSYEDIAGKKRQGEPLSVSEKAILNAIEKANKAVAGANTYFKYSIHEKTHDIVVKVVNSDTNEIVREIPSEKILDMVAKMWELAGLFVDEKR